jgi:hypothetical protein
LDRYELNRADIISGLKNLRTESDDAVLRPGENCLKPEHLARFLDPIPGEFRYSAHQDHVADCPFCLGQLAPVSRSYSDMPDATLPRHLLDQAEALVAGKTPAQGPARQSWRTRLPTTAALAASLVLAVTILLFKLAAPMAPPADLSEPRSTRNTDSGAITPQLLSPAEGSQIVPAEQVFSWTEVPGSLFYDVRLVDADGELMLRERVEGTRWLIPEHLSLVPESEYYVRVDAYLDDARFLSSEHIVFRVLGGQ